MNNFRFDQKIALITGASRGIGAAVAKALAAQGAHVVLVARKAAALEIIDDEIKAAGGSATLVPMDLLKMEKIDTIGPALAERFGRLDIFIGNAGMLGTLGPIAHANPKDWQKIFDLNVYANFRLLRVLDPLLKVSDAGRVVFSGSGTAARPKAYWAAYRASKAALNIMAQSYAQECVDVTNIKVNVIDPGAVDTNLLAKAYPGGYQDDDLKMPEDVVETYLDLCSAEYQGNGEIIEV